MHMVRLQASAETERGPAADEAYNRTVMRMEQLFEVTPWKVVLRGFWLTRDWAERAIFDEVTPQRPRNPRVFSPHRR